MNQLEVSCSIRENSYWSSRVASRSLWRRYNVKILGIWVAQEVSRRQRGYWSDSKSRRPSTSRTSENNLPVIEKSLQWSLPYCFDDNRGILNMNSERMWGSLRKIWKWVMAAPTRQCSCSQCLEHPGVFSQK